jgi:hydroxyethylthiazole kinase-like sugar kinase family protein
MTGTRDRLALAECSLRQVREVLSRNIGTITEQDWRDHLARQEARVAKLRKEPVVLNPVGQGWDHLWQRYV